MSILTKTPPATVCIDGEEYEINTDFRIYLSLENIIFDEKMPIQKRIAKILSCCYKRLPSSLDGALEALLIFYAGDVCKDNGGKGFKNGRGERILSFEEDADYILSSFLTEYGINLLKEDMHWWEFLALLRGLGQSCRLCEVIKYRTADISKIKNKEQRSFYLRQKKLYALKNTSFEDDDGIFAENLLKIF